MIPIRIDNELPDALTCIGRQYPETRDVPVAQVVLFIERDLHQLLASQPSIDASTHVAYVSRDGLQQIRIEIQLATMEATDFLFQRVEQILWSYNHLTILQKNGRLIPQRPRFQYPH